MKPKFIKFYMDIAERTSLLSRAVRLQVGSVIVKDDRVISIGYNGMPAGWDNDCEYKDYNSLHDSNYFELKTRPEVLHAESNAIAKLAKSTESGQGAALFVTHAPCIDCAKLIHQSGITDIYYLNDYRSSDGIEFLLKCGLNVEKVVE